MVGRTPKTPTRHDLDRVIIGTQVKLLQIAGAHGQALALAEWWRAHFGEDVTVPPAKED